MRCRGALRRRRHCLTRAKEGGQRRHARLADDNVRLVAPAPPWRSAALIAVARSGMTVDHLASLPEANHGFNDSPRFQKPLLLDLVLRISDESPLTKVIELRQVVVQRIGCAARRWRPVCRWCATGRS